jgi:hypothetical protein
MFFLFLLGDFFDSGMKKPAGLVAGGLCVSLDLSGRLVQAMAVRRHGVPMMMVVAVMAVALHLFQS